MTASRKLNFNAGPSALPQAVLQQASEAVLDYNGTGFSILELPHREREFAAILEESKQLIKELCGLSNDYEVLWLQGGGRMQFCMIPMNFTAHTDSSGYVDSGHWAEEASEYAMHYGDVQILSSSKKDNYIRLPEWPADISGQLAYLHYTTNNTIYGTQLIEVPDSPVPLIADMSSDIFCCTRDYSKCAMFYAAVQKNLGPAGLALVVISKDMLQRIKRSLPPMLSYAAQVKENSILNTPNVFGVYSCLLMLRWTKAKGIPAIEKDNRQKAKMLYDEIVRNRLFEAVVKTESDRSMMNACFTALNSGLEKAFLNFCAERNIVGVKGHRSVGGFRVSLYNAVTLDDVQQLVAVMKDFEHNNRA